MAELKPCPFCGGAASMCELETTQVGMSFPDHYVECADCGASGPLGGMLDEGVRRATDLWNRRAKEDPRG